jgi:hypothetical protein
MPDVILAMLDLGQSIQGDSKDNTVNNGRHVEGPAPTNGLSKDTTNHQSNTEADRLTSSHRGKCNVPALALRERTSDDAHC